MSWVSGLEFAVGLIATGVIAGYLLYWMYVFRERLDLRNHIPWQFRHWSLYAAVVIGGVGIWVYSRDPRYTVLFAAPAAGNLGLWVNDLRRVRKERGSA